MLCPVCHDLLVIVECEGIELDACVACRGLWFDAGELATLFRSLLSEEDRALDRVRHHLGAFLEPRGPMADPALDGTTPCEGEAS
jgi:Zn-finger nucleic acid-binding protein